MDCRFVAARMRRSTAPSLDAFDQRSPDIWAVFKACMALPGVAPAPVRVGRRRYIDGALLDPVPVCCNGQPLAERALVVVNEPRSAHSSFIERLMLRLLEWLWPAHRGVFAASAWRIASSRKRLHVAEAQGRALVVAPARPTPAPLATRSRRRIEDTMALGYEAALGMRDVIAAFLNAPGVPCAALAA
jgi:predicted acylesterase/phospholipase RssA